MSDKKELPVIVTITEQIPYNKPDGSIVTADEWNRVLLSYLNAINVNANALKNIGDQTLQNAEDVLNAVAGNLTTGSISKSELFKPGVVDTAALKDNAITKSKITDKAITADKLADNVLGPLLNSITVINERLYSPKQTYYAEERAPSMYATVQHAERNFNTVYKLPLAPTAILYRVWGLKDSDRAPATDWTDEQKEKYYQKGNLGLWLKDKGHLFEEPYTPNQIIFSASVNNNRERLLSCYVTGFDIHQDTITFTFHIPALEVYNITRVMYEIPLIEIIAIV
jgi:hypothetical protein